MQALRTRMPITETAAATSQSLSSGPSQNKRKAIGRATYGGQRLRKRGRTQEPIRLGPEFDTFGENEYEKICVGIVKILYNVCKLNDEKNSEVSPKDVERDGLSVFYTKNPPEESMQMYLILIMERLDCPIAIYICALIYLDRLLSKNPLFGLSKMNVKRLFVVTVLLASKFYEDDHLESSDFASICGLAKSDLMSLEIQALKQLDFSLKVDPTLYNFYVQKIQNKMGIQA